MKIKDTTYKSGEMEKMGMRKGVPHAKCSPLCAIKEKLQELWDRAYGCINKINDITPDGDGKFSIQAGSNIQLTEISNGLKIDTTGGVTYYTTTDPKLEIDNDALTIETVGVASQDDLDLAASGVTTNANAISDIIDGTTTVSKATDAVNAAYIENSTNSIGSDTKPVKVVNGKAVEVTQELATKNNVYFTAGDTFTSSTSIVVSGFIAGSQDGAYVEFPLWKSCENVTPTVTIMNFSLRGITATEAKTITAVSVAKSTPNLLRLGLTFNSATSNPVNSPITAFIDLSITFS